jgi:hypothetical protein
MPSRERIAEQAVGGLGELNRPLGEGMELPRSLETIEVSKRTHRWWREPPARFIRRW